MLRELRIRDFAVIDDLTLEPGAGLNVLTGETGAGKSIIVGALSLLLGARASSDVVRPGAERALIEAAFDVAERGALAARLREAGVLPDEGWLILRREVQREGRNRAWANGSPVTVGLLAELGDELVELHGQHEHQRLVRRDAQRDMLDAFVGAGDLAAEVSAAHRTLTALRQRIEARTRQAETTRERADLLRFRAAEIEKAGIVAGEDERLSTEASRLEHSEELLALTSRLHESVYAADGSLVDRLGELRRPLADLVRIDAGTSELAELAEAALRALEEIGQRVARYHDSVEHDPARLERIRARLDELYRLKAKYRGDLDAVLAAGRAASEELRSMETSELDIRLLEQEEESAGEAFRGLAGRLSAARREGAHRLGHEVSKALPDLGLAGGVFRVRLEPLNEPGAYGAERVEFEASLNPGFEPAPLARVASGGELSRLMLALKTVLVSVDRTPCLVFDEIDAGVGGEVANQVAARLRTVAEGHQVLVITHLPHIAASAHVHLRVEKAAVRGRATAGIRRLEGTARVEEVARLLGGDPESAVSRRHAEELLGGATRSIEPAGAAMRSSDRGQKREKGTRTPVVTRDDTGV